MPLPVLLAVPHAGLRVPPEVAELCLLAPEDLVADSDEDAAEIYAVQAEVSGFVAAEIARAFVDVNRPEDDRGRDGALKLITRRSKATVYRSPPSPETMESLLERYHRPYHRRLSALAKDVRLGIDCHTMAERRPGGNPETAGERPWICLSDAEQTCPRRQFYEFQRCLEEAFECVVSLNLPFKGGHTIRSHAKELPWVQLELSRAPYTSNAAKRDRLLAALEALFSQG
jgi:N-formylglutamate amidohydrolase